MVSLNGDDVAYPFSRLREHRVVMDRVGGRPIVVFYQPGTASALDRARIADSRDAGATGVFHAALGGRPLTFLWQDGAFVDLETGSRWSLLGLAVAGLLTGARLEPIVHSTHFWFATTAFYPNVRIWRP